MCCVFCVCVCDVYCVVCVLCMVGGGGVQLGRSRIKESRVGEMFERLESAEVEPNGISSLRYPYPTDGEKLKNIKHCKVANTGAKYLSIY